MCHPVYYVNHNKQISINNDFILDKIDKDNFTWNNLISGFSKKIDDFNVNNCAVYLKVNDLYESSDIDKLKDTQAVIEYIDTSEEETSLICVNPVQINNKNYTHMEIHPSLILGVMGNQDYFSRK